MAWSSTLMCGAQLSQQWPEDCFSYTIESGKLHPFEFFDKGLGTTDGKRGISPGAYLWVIPLCRQGYFWTRVLISWVCLLARCL